MPEAELWPTLEIKLDCGTVVDWVNGHAKMKTRGSTVEATQNLLREWWGRGIRLRQRTTEWVTHTFREHNKEADLWAGAKGRVEEWVDTTRIARPDVTGLCGFWDGSSATTAIVVDGIVIMLVRTCTDGPLSARSVDRYLVLTPWMLSWGCAAR